MARKAKNDLLGKNKKREKYTLYSKRNMGSVLKSIASLAGSLLLDNRSHHVQELDCHMIYVVSIVHYHTSWNMDSMFPIHPNYHVLL